MKAHWSEHPDRDEAWAAAERSRIGEERFRREHECEFLIYDETLISSMRLIEMEGKDPIWNMGQVRWYHKPRPKYTYMVASGSILGSGGDYSAIQVFELPTFKQMAEWHHNTTPANQQIRIYNHNQIYPRHNKRTGFYSHTQHILFHGKQHTGRSGPEQSDGHR
jgi:hypothetical protein